MPPVRSQHCPCPECQSRAGQLNQHYQRELAVFLATLNHEQRRLYAAVEANRLGRGGVGRVVELTGMGNPTVARGRRELSDLLQGKSLKKEPHSVGGRPRTEEKCPAITAALEEMLSDEVAGSPEGEHKWVRSSARKLAQRLKERGFSIGSSTVWALLKRMGFSMRTNVRRRRGITRDPGLRDEQFRYIASQRKAFAKAGLPVISVDTKKKELIGNFRNPGRAWCRKPPEVNEHDYASQAECLAVPFSVYDIARNKGYVVVGMSHNTPEFAVTSIARWWA
ncbi:MAG: ISAzo13 family transposase, partial [Acidobacteria bacterium]|nr:ISAzo13 family transposase [Acidobacteriota bacterium]